MLDMLHSFAYSVTVSDYGELHVHTSHLTMLATYKLAIVYIEVSCWVFRTCCLLYVFVD